MPLISGLSSAHGDMKGGGKALSLPSAASRIFKVLSSYYAARLSVSRTIGLIVQSHVCPMPFAIHRMHSLSPFSPLSLLSLSPLHSMACLEGLLYPSLAARVHKSFFFSFQKGSTERKRLLAAAFAAYSISEGHSKHTHTQAPDHVGIVVVAVVANAHTHIQRMISLCCPEAPFLMYASTTHG